MEKRVLLAVFLSFLVLYAYQAIVPHPKPRPVQARRPAAAQSTPPGAVPAPAAKPDASPNPEARNSEAVAETAPPNAGATTAAPAAAVVQGESAERPIVVETATVVATFDNKGAELTSWRLKHYDTEEGKRVDLVPANLPASMSRPFEFRLEDKALTARVNDGLYRVTVDGKDAGQRIHVQAPTVVTFEYEDAAGLAARKTFTFQPDGYVLTFSSSVIADGRTLNPVLLWGPGLGDTVNIVGQKSSNSYAQHSQGILYSDGKVHRLPPKEVEAAPSHQGRFPFAGIDDHYFIATLVEPGLVRVQYDPTTAPMPGSDARRELMSWNVLFAKPPHEVRFFIGPKDFDVLAAVDRTLVKAIYFGMLDFLAVPLLRALKWINAYIGNYGWSIVVLTILINVVLFPLRHKSVVSMRRMQELQPQIKAIQDRYAKYKATDPERQKMNQELMALYKQKGVNPASGCLPMLLTMPVLFAFYSLLSVAIEMRGAPFALWIRDLSVHDPYYITPIIMAGTMLWQQRLTPIADPAQQKVMMLTPLIFLTFFLWAPSGLVVYWTVSNLLGIGQQYATNRIIGAPVVKQVRPPAERRVKNVAPGAEGARDKAS